ncbi:hypothetical protein MMC25_004129 [Agyrium rufum]|nr:hypothetical protein [Agyrium rufum]
MEAAGLVLAVVGTADICLKYGKELMKRYRLYRDAESEVYMLMLRVEGCWLKTEQQIELLNKIWDVVQDEMKSHFDEVLQVLQNKLSSITAAFDKIIRTKQGVEKHNENSLTITTTATGVKKFKFAVLMRDHLESAVKTLEQWQNYFDPSWFLLLRISDPKVDQQLQAGTSHGEHESSSLSTLKTLRNEIDSLSSPDPATGSIFFTSSPPILDRTPMSYSQAIIASLKSSEAVIVDRVICDPLVPIDIVTKDVRDLARILSRVEPLTFGLLSCRGVLKETGNDGKVTGFEFLFNVPSHLDNPRSLRSVLLSPPEDIPLNEKFALVAHLARSIFFMHASRFVHKNVRPENILIFGSGTQKLGKPFLIGFEKFRMDATRSTKMGDAHWERDLYRHPRRQGMLPESEFVMQHDIYSLGVVLLEVGLGFSFVVPDEEEVAVQSRQVDDAIAPVTGSEKSSAKKFHAHPDLGIKKFLDSKDLPWKSDGIKKRFGLLARRRLPATMGLRYSQVVIACLTCLDDDNDGIGDESEFLDDDGVLVGVRFIEKILTLLDGISI